MEVATDRCARSPRPVPPNDPTPPEQLRVLVVEDSEDDAFFVLRELEQFGYDVISERVETREAMERTLESRHWDVVLSDFSMPRFDALLALDVVKRSSQRGLPFIIVSGAIGEETAVAAMRAGAHDYVLKDKLDRLAPVVERELRAARDRLQSEHLERRLLHADRLAAIGQLAAGVAHEINNPLAFIIGNVEILGEHIDAMRALVEASRRMVEQGDAGAAEEIRLRLNSGELAHALYDMREIRIASMAGAERIAAIVRDLRTFARIEDDDVELVQMNDVVRIACNMVENTIRHKAVLERELDELPRFAGDRGKLTQAIVNLLVNAAQAIDEGEVGENRVRVATRRDGDMMHLTVEDTGVGIPEVIRKQIFEPFFTTKSRDEGTGLGLALCADIVRKHGGTITVDSELGQGTCFTMRIPLDTGLIPQRRRAATGGDDIPSMSARILVVDDERQVLRTFERILKNEHEVELAVGGEQALALLERDQDFDIILCDLMMPNIDGLMFYRELAQRTPTLAERIIFITGGAFTARMNEFVSKIGNRVLEKPVSAKRLRRVIDSHSRRRARIHR